MLYIFLLLSFFNLTLANKKNGKGSSLVQFSGGHFALLKLMLIPIFIYLNMPFSTPHIEKIH